MGADRVEPRGSDYSAVPYRSTPDDTVSREETAVLDPVTGEDVNLSESPNQPETDLPSSGEAEEMTQSESTETENTWKFTLWRRSRPFGGGLCMILSGIVLMVPAYLTLKVGDMLVTVSSLSGVSTLLLGVLLIVCGLLAWFRADGRILWGVAAMLMGIIALPTSNIGGFLLGTILALIGGAWALSWTPFSRDKNASKKNRKKRTAAESATAAVSALAITAGVSLVGHNSPIASADPSTTSATPSPTPHPDPSHPNLPLPFPWLPGSQPSSQNSPGNPIPVPGLLAPLQKQAENTAKQAQDAAQKAADDASRAIGGGRPLFENAPPQRVDELVVPGSTYRITTDKTTLVGNVSFSLVQIPTTSGELKRAIRIDADKAILDNLAVQFLGTDGGGDVLNSTGPGKITTLTGHFQIIVSSVTLTPKVAGLKTVPLTLDASKTPQELNDAIGAGVSMNVPDAISSQMVMEDDYMNTYVVRADSLIQSDATIASE